MQGPIALEHGTCTQAFDRLCDALGKTQASYALQMPLSSVLDEYGRFNVWYVDLYANDLEVYYTWRL